MAVRVVDLERTARQVEYVMCWAGGTRGGGTTANLPHTLVKACLIATLFASPKCIKILRKLTYMVHRGPTWGDRSTMPRSRSLSPTEPRTAAQVDHTVTPRTAPAFSDVLELATRAGNSGLPFASLHWLLVAQAFELGIELGADQDRNAREP
jgi:hypothetical protein